MFGFLADVLAWCYDVVPNYGLAIGLFTLLIMAVLTPFNIKGMRSMAEMARLQPEMKRLQDQFKNDRVKMNEEMQALFKEHKVNPLGGCLPTLLPFPVLFVMFRLLEHLTGRNSHQIFDPRRVLNTLPEPHYLSHTSSLYAHLVHDGGKMVSFGFDLGKSARQAHGAAAIPFYLLIVLMTVSQYVMQQQINKRNPQAAAANPQMKLTMQIFPIFYAVISLNLAASVVLYLLISGLLRMAQNIVSYKYDPKLQLAPIGAGAGKVIEAAVAPKGNRPKNPKNAKSAKNPKNVRNDTKPKPSGMGVLGGGARDSAPAGNAKPSPNGPGAAAPANGTSPTANGTSPTAEGTSPTAEGTSPTAEGTSPTAEGTSPTADGRPAAGEPTDGRPAAPEPAPDRPSKGMLSVQRPTNGRVTPRARRSRTRRGR